MAKRLFSSLADAEALSAKNRAARKLGLGPLAPNAPLKALDQLHQAQRPMIHRLKPPSETDECRTFIAWTKLVRYRGRPLFDRIAKIPNDRGKRSVFTAIMVAIGMKRGFPDYIVLAPMLPMGCLVGGLFLEAKRADGGKVDEDQLAWRDLLREFGYRSEICEGSAEMIAAVRRYMEMAPPGVWQDTTRGSM